jgi:Tfp pilus assembly protein PilN
MLRTNLATRPFYDVRRIHAALAAVALLLAAFTAYNLWQLVALSRRDTALAATIRQSDAEAARLRQDAARARARIDRQALEAVLEASQEANALIDRRVFSWTGLLNGLETTLPAGVRIRSIRPVAAEGRLHVELVVLARSAEDIERFVENLQGTGSFQDVFARSENTQEDGTLEALLEGTYLAGPAAGEATGAPAPGGR